MYNKSKIQSRAALFLVAVLILTGSAIRVSAMESSLVPVSDSIFHDNRSKKDWQMNRSSRMKDVEEVQHYLQKLNTNGDTGWRLPTKEELYSLFSLFDLKENGKVKIRLEGKYWLQDEADTIYVGAWEIGDQCEPTRSFFRGNAGYIRAVRP
ncbi:DUF1566 domain-containing protein [Desulfopila aestuarii]|uniref:DUF1566 domain-containing protein n=1 Tax=Desulfopila aestuarii DSM 18488 TaxID=1121416 RepID=A0A1M7Y4M5_9BACT|nr:DUF1566 domain-containing protein [Desulfopila aestuarii]SHO47288.1 Protein of unknown function [Desulfopila aestuarii DSM 18488]